MTDAVPRTRPPSAASGTGKKRRLARKLSAIGTIIDGRSRDSGCVPYAESGPPVDGPVGSTTATETLPLSRWTRSRNGASTQVVRVSEQRTCGVGIDVHVYLNSHRLP